MFDAKLVGYEMNVTCLCTVLDLQKENTDNCIQVLTKTGVNYLHAAMVFEYNI